MSHNKKITDSTKVAAMRARAEAGKKKRADRLAREKATRDAKKQSQQASKTQQTVNRKPIKADRFETVSDPITNEKIEVKSGTDEARNVKDRLNKKGKDAQSALNKQAADRARARRAERKRKQRFEGLVKKGGGSKNILKKTADKFGVNSPQYKKLRNEVNRYESPTSNVRTAVNKQDTSKIDEKKGLTQSQYNKLISKYGDASGVSAAIIKRYGKNSVQAKRVDNLLSKFSKPEAKKFRENTSTITDVSKGDIGDNLTGVVDKKEKTPAFIGRDVPSGEDAIDTVRKNRQDRLDKLDQDKINKEKSGERAIDTVNKNKQDRLNKINTEKIVETIDKRRLAGETDEDILKTVEDKVGKDSEQYRKLKEIINSNLEKKGDEEISSDLLDRTKEELEKGQIDSLEDIKDDNISTTAENFIKSSELISNNNKNLQDFYVTMAEDLRAFLKTSEANKRAALEKTKSSRLNKVVGQIRATLARRGIDIGKISPEQLIAMSGQVGADAMADINDAILKTENEIIELTQNSTNEINALKEKGLIKQNEADSSIEQMRQLKEKMISDIRANYISNAFKISRASIADKDQNKAEVLNTISTFVSQLGISGTAQGIMENYLDAGDSVEALENMIQDLNDTESELYKAVDDVEKANQAAAELKARLDIMKATKSKGGGPAPKKSTRLTSKQQILLGKAADILGLPLLKDITNISEYRNYLGTLTKDQRRSIDDTLNDTIVVGTSEEE